MERDDEHGGLSSGDAVAADSDRLLRASASCEEWTTDAWSCRDTGDAWSASSPSDAWSASSPADAWVAPPRHARGGTSSGDAIAADSDRLPPATAPSERTPTRARPEAETAEPWPAEPPLWRDERDGRMPLRQVPLGPRVPDLERIDRASWPAALEHLDRPMRTVTALQIRDPAVLEFVRALPPPPAERARWDLAQAPPFPVPEVDAVPRRGTQQVNVRLTLDDYARLVLAARLLATKPTALARILIVNGSRRVLSEHAPPPQRG